MDMSSVDIPATADKIVQNNELGVVHPEQIFELRIHPATHYSSEIKLTERKPTKFAAANVSEWILEPKWQCVKVSC